MNGLFASAPEALEDQCLAFVQVQAWPLMDKLNWKGWLGNFVSTDERYFAHCLLEGFLYYNGAHSDALFLAAFHGLSRTIARSAPSTAEGIAAWQQFLRTVIITYVEGEKPSPTDSGYAFARRARDLFGIPEARIVAPRTALKTLAGSPGTPIVFVDDILGSGKQLEETWIRDYGEGISFAGVAARDTVNVWYTPLLATAYGVARVAPLTAGVTIAPAHLITERYSANDPNSIIWRPGEQAAGRDFVEAVSVRAGYGPSQCWGFHELGLSVGVLDTIPDASLPLFYSERKGWRPLMRRRSP